MDMLRRLMELECQLIDYERITDESGRRLIFFSRFAGLAGAIDALWALGRRLEWEGIAPNPFAALEQTYRYPTLEAALDAIRRVAARISSEGLPATALPVRRRDHRLRQRLARRAGGRRRPRRRHGGAGRIDDLFEGPAPRHAVHKVVFAERDMVARRDGAPFKLDEYLRQPELYEGAFERRLPRLAVLLNCVFWDTPYPRLVTKAAVQRLFASAGPPRLRVIADVSCDIEGSVELTVKETHIDEPVYVYDPDTGRIADGVEGKGPVVLAVGNLPCELSRESSEAFSAALSPFVPALAAGRLLPALRTAEPAAGAPPRADPASRRLHAGLRVHVPVRLTTRRACPGADAQANRDLQEDGDRRRAIDVAPAVAPELASNLAPDMAPHPAPHATTHVARRAAAGGRRLELPSSDSCARITRRCRARVQPT